MLGCNTKYRKYRRCIHVKEIIDTLNLILTVLVFPVSLTTHLALGDVEMAYINFEKSYVDYHLLKILTHIQINY